jgi:transposase
MGETIVEEHIRSVLPHLDEKQKRLFLASCANTLGWGGIKKVCEISGCSKDTVIRGKRELESSEPPDDERVRKVGGGRKKAEETHPELLFWIERIVADSTYGNPENPLTWTTQSLRKVQDMLLSEHQVYVSVETTARLLRKLEYSLQGNKKMLQVGEAHPDRNEQFEYINDLAKIMLSDGQPVISVDTKKKENIGNFKNNGTEYRKNKDPREVLDHDFPLKELGKVAPYGVYVINDNTAYVNLGTSHDTGEFAVESISRWWGTVGKKTFVGAYALNINCDCGGSNGNRARLWKYQLQQFANRTRLVIYVSHFPPGTSKWNKIEHRLFCYISKNWAGKPLIDVDTVINLISSTTTRTGLTVMCERDDNVYPLSQKVSDEEFKSINIRKVEPYGEWNYIILPT